LLNQPLTLKSFFKDYELLIKKIKEKTNHTEIVLIKPFAVTGQKSNIDMLKDLDIFRSDCDRLAKEYDLKLIDIKDEINKKLVFMPAESIFYDGIHPSLLGHEIIKTVITDFIRGNLNDI
jgi:lysophospholipase L1-like esterase